MAIPVSPRIVVIPWYSPGVFARLRAHFPDAPAILRGSYEQWRQQTARDLRDLHDAGQTVIRLDIEEDAWRTWLSSGIERVDYGNWCRDLAALARSRSGHEERNTDPDSP